VRICVTGGAGFIGQALVSRLLERGHDVTVLDTDAVPSDDVRVVQGDVRDTEAVLDAAAQSDVLVHLAALTGVGQSMYELRDYTAINGGGTAAVLEVLPRTSVQRIVLASSRAVYGEGTLRCTRSHLFAPGPRPRAALDEQRWDHSCPVCGAESEVVPTPETSPMLPTSVYGATKAYQEHATRAVCMGRGVESVVLRPFNVYGPRQRLDNPYTGILGVFARNGREGRPSPVYEDGRMVRDFVFVDDVVLAFLSAVERGAPAPDAVANVGTGTGTTVWELAQLVAELQGAPAPVVTGECRVGDIRHSLADAAAAESLLDVRCTTDLHTGVSRYLDWFEDQPLPAVPDPAVELRNEGLWGASPRPGG